MSNEPTVDVEQAAEDLVAALEKAGVHATRFTTGPGTAGLNVWGEDARYPVDTVTISDSGRFHDYAWGPNYQHTLPVATPTAEVLAAIIATLP